jgi:EmrB/QacA subfamily drug resistance transporter
VISRAFLIPLIISCALFMENMDATVITTALPALAHDFGRDPVSLKLALIAYVVALGVFIPICGWMADRFGARTIFSTAIAIFLTGSVLCAASTSLGLLVVARFIQGVGGAMMVPVGRIIIFRSIPRADLVKAIAYLTTPAMIGPVLGPPLGGFITTNFGWRWCFLINLPIGIYGIYLSHKHIADTREARAPRLDLSGFILAALGAASLMLGLSLIGDKIVADSYILVLIAIGVLASIAYIRHAHSIEEPILDPRLLRIATLRASVLGGSLFRIGLGAIPFLLPLMLQEGFGLSPLHSGAITCASAFGSLFMKGIAQRVLRRYGFRRVLMGNAICAGIALASYGLFREDTPRLVMFMVVAFGGFFPSLQFTCLNSIAYADIAPSDAGRATSLASTVQQLSLGFGVTVSGALVQLTQKLHGHAVLQQDDFWPAFVAVGVLSMLSVRFTARLPANAGQEMAGTAKSVQVADVAAKQAMKEASVENAVEGAP